MKHIIYHIVFAMLFMVGCSDYSITMPEEKQDVKYIFFSHQLQTKASLIESPGAMQKFGVVGFKYDYGTNWNAYKALTPAPVPNVFYDLKANSNPAEYELVNVETVTCDSGTNGIADGEYAPLQGWSNHHRYTFFAYYPIDKNSVELVNLDGNSYTGGVPAIKYTMSNDDNTTSDVNEMHESMVDVMVAEHIDPLTNENINEDLYWKSTTDNNINNGDITFSFGHRLSCLGVKIKNTSSTQIELASLTLSVSNILYDQIIIPLDGSASSREEAETPMSATISLDFSDSETTISTSAEQEIVDKLIFIPQTQNISVRITSLSYRREGDYIDTTISAPASDYNGNVQYLTTPLAEGTKNLIHINFKDSYVDVSGVINSEGWVTIPDVEDTFN